ncbi:MAG: hypothetical protein LBL54_03180 [Clostridiales Family XIII bacterium]|jgi:uncharacterized membrane protein YcgQ (UPF0703/DUF1980 family)|nr:hypothetical protein [Clostridiales Family XIII bacterium]
MKKKVIITVLCFVTLIAALLLSACDGGASGRAKDAANADTEAQTNGGGTASVDVSQETDGSADSAANGDLAEDGSSELVADGSSAAAGTDTGEVLEIGEKMFVGQMNDIYLNPDEYLGKTIRYEGFFTFFENEETGQRYDCVVRNGPGCCGYDSSVGFEVDWKGDLPEVDDWCSVEGVVDIYDENGLDYIVVRADSLSVLPYRGNDTVVQ